MDENMEKGKRVQRWRKAYNLMQCDQKTRTDGILFFFLNLNLVLLKNRSWSRVLILPKTNGI